MVVLLNPIIYPLHLCHPLTQVVSEQNFGEYIFKKYPDPSNLKQAWEVEGGPRISGVGGFVVCPGRCWTITFNGTPISHLRRCMFSRWYPRVMLLNAGFHSTSLTTPRMQKLDAGGCQAHDSIWTCHHMFMILCVFHDVRYFKVDGCHLVKIPIHRFQFVFFIPAVYPSNAQFRAHFREFLTGYRSSAESVEITFPKAKSCRTIADFSVGIVDGFLKTMLMIGITVIISELVP